MRLPVGLFVAASIVGFTTAAGAQDRAWIQQAELEGKETSRGSSFGSAIAASGDTVIVGAPGASFSVQGAAYLFAFANGAWRETQRLAPTATPSAFFGGRVALDGDVAVVLDAVSGAHVYERSPGRPFVEKAVLVPEAHADLADVALHGSMLVLAAASAGAAYVYERPPAGTWQLTAKLTAPGDPPISSFGAAVAFDQDDPSTLLVDMPGGAASDAGTQPIAVLPFVRGAAGWTAGTPIVPPPMDGGASADDGFGTRLAVRKGRLLVGAPRWREPSGFPRGYVVELAGGGGQWAYGPSFVSVPSLMGAAELGSGLALSDGFAAFGAPWTSSSMGLAFVAAIADGGAQPPLPQPLQPDNAIANDQVGAALALDENLLVVGAPYKTLDQGVGAGAAYVFRYVLPQGAACQSGDDCPSGFCVDGVCCDGACGGGDRSDCLACDRAGDGRCTIVAAEIQCRAASGECAPAAACDGVNPTCPATVARPNGTLCAGGRCIEGSCVAANAPPPGPDAGADGGPSGHIDWGGSLGGGCDVALRDDAGPLPYVAAIVAALLAMAAAKRGRR